MSARFLLLAVALLASPEIAAASPGCAAEVLPAGRRLQRSVDVGGVKREFIVDAPPSLQAGQPVPLLFVFHGFGHSAAGLWQVAQFKDAAVKQRFVTVFPDGHTVRLLGRDGPGWEIFSFPDNRDVKFVRAMLDDLEQSFCIDRKRVYATGFSNGAFFSNVLGCVMPERFAAIAPVAGGLLSVACQPQRAVPVIIHHGRNDPLLTVQRARAMRDTWVQINGCKPAKENKGCEVFTCRDGAEVQYCEDDSEHRWPAAATDRIWNFVARFALP